MRGRRCAASSRVGGDLPAARAGDEIELVLDRTPFYAEGGGQLADQGVIQLDDGARLEVHDVQSPVTGLIVHRARSLAGEVSVGTGAQALVDVDRRLSISRAHTATHMVHKAFREALGETATQAGSENAPGRFRFDFSATGAVPARSCTTSRTGSTTWCSTTSPSRRGDEPGRGRESGAMALFGEKYGDQVRVVSVGDWARELCGGTHADRSGQLGVVKLLGEASIGSGVRRVEALVGADAYRFLAREHVLVAQLSEALKVRPEQLPERVDDIVERLRSAEKEIEKVRVAQLLAAGGQLAARRETWSASSVVAHRADGAGGGDVRTLALDVRGRLPAAARRGGGHRRRDGKVVGRRRRQRRGPRRGVSANELVRAVGPLLGGRGGGKDDVAQGGGTDASRSTRRWRWSTPRSPRRAGAG